MNLLSNAIKFTPFSGKVTVTSRLIKNTSHLKFQDPAFLRIMAKNVGKIYLEVQVEDTGIGIKEEDQQKLFKLFGFINQDKQLNSKGIGLGLLISKQITMKFDGDIICRSKLGKGSNFIFIVALDHDSNLTGN